MEVNIIFIIIQIPFVDFRLLKNEKNEKYFFPHTWTREPIYYRFFGHKTIRKNSDSFPLCEQTFYKPQKPKKIFSYINHDSINAKIVFTRLLSDNFFFHIDIGIKIINANNKTDPIQTINNLFSKGFLYAPPLKKILPFSIKEFHTYIENLYNYATTYICNKVYLEELMDKTNLYFGKPAVYCQGSFYKINKTELKTIHEIDDNIVLYKGNLKIPAFNAHLWIMQKNNFNGVIKDQLRNLRICLLLLHNYREGLIGIFKYLGKNSLESCNVDNIKIMFAYLLRRLNESKLYGYDGKHIMDDAIKNDSYIFYETWDKLITCLKEYYMEIKSIQKERRKMGNEKNEFNGPVFQAPVYVNRDQVFGNITYEENQQIIDFLKELDSRISEIVSDEVKEQLINKKNELNEYIRSKNKSKLTVTWDSIKNILKSAISNANNLATLFTLGEKVMSLL